jgi:hypothetical protein
MQCDRLESCTANPPFELSNMVVFKRAVIPSILSLSGCILPWPSSTIQDAFWAVHVFVWCTWLHWSCRRKRSFCCTISLKNTPGCSTTLSAGGVGILPCVEACCDVCTKPDRAWRTFVHVSSSLCITRTLQISLSIFCCLYRLFGTVFAAAASLNFLHLHLHSLRCPPSFQWFTWQSRPQCWVEITFGFWQSCTAALRASFMILVRYSTQAYIHTCARCVYIHTCMYTHTFMYVEYQVELIGLKLILLNFYLFFPKNCVYM